MATVTTISIFCLILSDLKLPGLSGLDLLKGVGRRIPVILMTAYGDASIATEAAQLGAYDYLSKPILPDELIFKLRKFEEVERLQRENSALKEAISERYSFSKIIARSDAFKAVFDTVKRFSQSSLQMRQEFVPRTSTISPAMLKLLRN